MTRTTVAFVITYVCPRVGFVAPFGIELHDFYHDFPRGECQEEAGVKFFCLKS